MLQFLLIFRKAAAGELQDDSGLSLLASLSEIDVDKTGVGKSGFYPVYGHYSLSYLFA